MTVGRLRTERIEFWIYATMLYVTEYAQLTQSFIALEGGLEFGVASHVEIVWPANVELYGWGNDRLWLKSQSILVTSSHPAWSRLDLFADQSMAITAPITIRSTTGQPIELHILSGFGYGQPLSVC